MNCARRSSLLLTANVAPTPSGTAIRVAEAVERPDQAAIDTPTFSCGVTMKPSAPGARGLLVADVALVEADADERVEHDDHRPGHHLALHADTEAQRQSDR